VIVGHVNSRTEAIVSFVIRSAFGSDLTVGAVIDTGFSGYLSLPPATIGTLRLAYSTSRAFSLGDNTPVSFDLYEATVEWDGKERDILVLASEAQPLVGMSLLKGFRLTVDAVDGGEVRIEALRPRR
jgi:clan AA aspartic protease